MEEYIVQQGDSYWAIAKRLGIDPVELLRMNGLTMSTVNEIGALHVGDSIKVPPQPVTTQATTDEAYGMDWDAPNDDYDWVAPSAPVQDLVGDPAYDAFLAQYGFDVGAAEQSRISQGLLLEGAMSRQLGELTDPSANPYSQTAARTGSMFDIGLEKDLERSENVYAGRGMAFSGGKFKAAADIGTDWGLKEADYWSEVNKERNILDQTYMDKRRDLEMQKLAQESSAYQRRVTEDIMAQYG
jgi:murein DD-endopeptidase MepM/ murein hydrolase activator NlpD